MDGAGAAGEPAVPATQIEPALPEPWISPQRISRLAPGQDYVDGTLYYHLDTGEGAALLTSRRRLLAGSDVPAHLRLPPGEPNWPRISGAAVKRFLEGAEAPRAHAIHARVRAYVLRFVPLDDAAADLVALWLMHTYLFRIFARTPYLLVRGEAGSGAAILAEILARLAWNGDLHRALTPATVMAEVGRGTAVFDLTGAAALIPDAVFDDLITGASAPGERVETGEGGRTFRRTVYAPRAFATDARNVDLRSLGSLGIRLDALPPHPDFEAERFRPEAEADEMRALVDDLHLFALASASDVAAVCANDLVPVPDGIDRGLWEPLFALATLVDQLDPAAGTCRRLSRLTPLACGGTPGIEDLSARLARLLGETVDTGQPAALEGRWYGARQMHEHLCETLEVPEIERMLDLVEALARLGIRSERRYFPGLNRYERCFELEPAHLADLRDRFGIRFVPGALAGAANDRQPARQEVA